VIFNSGIQNQLPKVIKGATFREGVEVISQARPAASFKPSPKITHTSNREPSHADIASVDERWDW
jgi:hypothetical protein